MKNTSIKRKLLSRENINDISTLHNVIDKLQLAHSVIGKNDVTLPLALPLASDIAKAIRESRSQLMRRLRGQLINKCN